MPAGVLVREVHAWAWSPSHPGSASTYSSFLPDDTQVVRPRRDENAIFHPPRRLLSTWKPIFERASWRA